MYDHNQLEIPGSFMALYLIGGRLKPNASRGQITTRYELCEDLAGHLCEFARAQHHDLGISEDVVLKRCHVGLLEESSGLSASEATWAIRRLAEIEGWDPPDFKDREPEHS